MAALYGVSGDYEQRCRQLVDAHVAVWDVLEGAVRPGSLDSSIRTNDAQTNDFEGFFGSHPNIRCVAFNGKKAQGIFRKLVVPELKVELPELVSLPSTSPAHASLSFDKKLAIWRSILAKDSFHTK